MPIWNRAVSKLITVRYRIALGVIALLVTISFVITALAIDAHRQRVEVIDYAAKQRMYSQRIPFLANELAVSGSDQLRQVYLGALKRAVSGMERAHAILSLEAPLNMPRGSRSILRDAYYSGPQPFDDQMERFLAYARSVLKAENLQPDVAQLVRLSNMSSTYLLETHELVYNLLRNEALGALKQFIGLAGVLWILTLAVIGLEVPLIFRPMAGSMAERLRSLDRARQEAQREAAEAEAARDDNIVYMRIMNHEMRTPLNAILGMASLMRMNELPQKQDEYAKQIQQAARHLMNLINHILDFREIEANLVRVKMVRVNLKDELEKILSTFRPLAEEKGLEMSCRAESDFSVDYAADGARIRQILAYLIGNAIKFTEEGSIILRARREGAGESADLVRFEVQDTGLGVPPELREHIFREWRQVEDTLARKYGGTGLGLAIARRLVHLMDGDIGVESADGTGSLFWFTLPLERARAPAHEVSAAGGAERVTPGRASES